jgi:low affinity Fe/Cu permease
MNTTINPEDRRRLRGKRTRAITFLRLKSGLINDFTPWKIVPLLLLCIAFIVVWNMRGNLNPFDETKQWLFLIYDFSIAVIIPAVFALLLVGLMLLITRPGRARKIEDCFLQMGLVDHCGYPPALISRKRVKNTGVSVMTFYTLGISRDIWERRSEDIQDALNIRLVESIKYGGKNGRNRNIIVLAAASGAGGTGRKDELYDDEL